MRLPCPEGMRTQAASVAPVAAWVRLTKVVGEPF